MSRHVTVIAAMHQAGASIKTIAVEIGASVGLVKKCLRRAGIKIETPSGKRYKLTPADVEKMIEMRRGGATIKAIAVEIGASAASVQYYLRRAGLSNPSGRSSRLTSADIEKMTAMYKGGATYATIAAEIGVSSPTARRYLLQSGVAEKQPWRSSVQHRYTAADIERIKAMRQAGAKIAAIAAEIGVSGKAIANILDRFGLVKRIGSRT